MILQSVISAKKSSITLSRIKVLIIINNDNSVIGKMSVNFQLENSADND